MKLLTTEQLEESCELSKNHTTRTKSQSSTLYCTIQAAVALVQHYRGSDESAEPLSFLTVIFEPLIKDSAYNVYKFSNQREEYDDILQQCYLFFIELVYAYDSSISQFAYFVKSMLQRQLNAWSKKQAKKFAPSIDSEIVNNTLVDPSLCDANTVYLKFNEAILKKEMDEFMEIRANKKARSITVKTVCYKYFMGTHTCKQISEELEISYHAVYEVIKRIERDYREFLKEHSIIGFA